MPSIKEATLFVLYFSVCSIVFLSCKDQVPKNNPEPEVITVDSIEVERSLAILSSDSLEGRQVFTPGIEKAADFLKTEYASIGLESLEGLNGYEDTFGIRFPGDSNEIQQQIAKNIIGVIPGKTKKDQYVIFSAHYDHIGILDPVNGDSIANGADDDASGVAAVLALARYYKRAGINEPTLVFAAFSAEEIGLVGSKNFIREIDPDKVIAMINIEMIGKDSKFGPNSVFMTGYDRSDLGQILSRNLKGTNFSIHPDPYPQMNLFYRSDNASFAEAGVPAHTISTVQIDKDIYYHTVDDEISTLKIKNLVYTIEAIIRGSKSIVDGSDIPARVKKQ